MVEAKAGGAVDVKLLERAVGGAEILIGYPDRIRHPDSNLDNATLAGYLHEVERLPRPEVGSLQNMNFFARRVCHFGQHPLGQVKSDGAQPDDKPDREHHPEE